MQLKITTETKEIIIDFKDSEKSHVENQISLCLDGSYYYINIKDKEENTHFLSSGFLKNSYITIIESVKNPYENDTL
ncbi:hypothetical protein [Chryseobacterium binzhouense]|uniref:hypothetical protein n=1 Tax=Chryseobacterium binzhouense TaxID=2593646 RepID=UPI0028A28CD8|nr:hypothetical protein [Chryseobacterium binzhouense]